ncbi:MAG: hypothetical protein ABWX60_10430, partial [Aeromicrobium sp.]
RLSAGSGVTHAERNASDTEPLRFVQMMLRSRNWDAPEYAQVQVPEGPGLHETVPVHADARLQVARPAGGSIEVVADHGALLHVTRGPAVIDGTSLESGDELRVDGAATLHVTGETAEIMVWRLVGPRG